MTTLAANSPRDYEIGQDNHIGAVAADIIFEGAAVGENGSGFGRPLSAGDPFVGFAVDKCDNAAGSAGAKNIQLRRHGRIQLAIGSLAIGDVGKAVYASDDDTFVLTKSTNSYVGRVVRFVSSGVGVVEFHAGRGGMASIGALTDNTDATADTTIADVSTAVTGVDGTGNNAASKADVDARLTAIDANFADLVAQLDLLRRQLAD